MHEADLLAAIRAAPDDDGPRMVHADWLLSCGDVRGELIVLDVRERCGALETLEQLDQLDRLLELSATLGFPKLPDDPCAGILPFQGDGAYPTQYHVEHDGHRYYVGWNNGFSVKVDDVTVAEPALDTLCWGQWTFLETTVILAIASEAITGHRALADLVFPSYPALRGHPAYIPGRAPLVACDPKGRWFADRVVEARDSGRWRRLFRRRLQLAGVAASWAPAEGRCACGVDGISCRVYECETW